MDWDQIAKGWKQLAAIIASPQSVAQEIYSQPDDSIRTTPSAVTGMAGRE